MIRKTLIAVIVFVLMGGIVLAVGLLADPTTSISPITQVSPCPVVQGCATGKCHGFDNVPEPDGIHEMACPEAACSSTECHAWDTLSGRYHQASDASLNVWILAPVALVVALVLLVKKVG